MDRQKTAEKIKFFSKEYWKQYNWKTILINLAIYWSIFFVALLIDLLTKHYLFKYHYDENNNLIIENGVLYQNALFGIRSVQHAGTTIEIGLGNVGLHIISFIIILATSIVSALFKDKIYRYIIPGFAFIAAGAMGNMVDRFAFEFVRDIVFLPWIDKGTFNFADVWLVLGGIACVISMLTVFIIVWRKEKKDEENKKNQEYNEHLHFESSEAANIIDPNHQQ
ncbi:signal peptidase II [[Mycoplasma] anseris]|uniref:Signal peptidase II n=1 Tax=[Mycoplasma] anseris TaxID=92400 RepID=A0A2Z4NDS9_9BACT|nr:signal peptidase II [[Mycoplasma] anseris]AWX69656.1 signal peptidase II [[Mycoplasma] anseris]